MLGVAHGRRGQLTESTACFNKVLQLKPDYAAAQSSLACQRLYDPSSNPEQVVELNLRWGAQFAPIASPPRTLLASEKIIIGYVSPDFRRHAVSAFRESVLANHGPRRVDVVCYSDVEQADVVTHWLKQLVPRWRDVCGQTDDELEPQIRGDGVHILVDLAGRTGRNRLKVFTGKPAPV